MCLLVFVSLGTVTTQLPGINDYCGGKVVFIDTEVCYSITLVSDLNILFIFDGNRTPCILIIFWL